MKRAPKGEPVISTHVQALPLFTGRGRVWLPLLTVLLTAAVRHPLKNGMEAAGIEGDSDARSSQVLDGNSANSEASTASRSDPPWSSAESTVTLSHEAIREALEAARAEWMRS